MASKAPEPGVIQAGPGHPVAGSCLAAGSRFMLRILVGFLLTGVLFFTLLALWSILAGPFVQLQSASFVIVCALATSVPLGVWLCRRFERWRSQSSTR